MAPKSVTFRRHDHLVSVLFGDLLSHSYNITFSMFLYLVLLTFGQARSIYILRDCAKDDPRDVTHNEGLLALVQKKYPGTEALLFAKEY